jgi:hypothetical protein
MDAHTTAPRFSPKCSSSADYTPDAHNLDAYATAGFNAMCLANNHVLDAGYGALLQNISRLKPRGGFLPRTLSTHGAAHPHGIETPEGKAVVSYLDKCHRSQRPKGRFMAEGARRISGFETLQVVPGDPEPAQ